MKLIIGLGNPGLRYKNTRHNIGFLVVKEISANLHISLRKRRHNGFFGVGSLDGKKVGLFMPETYMNLSGKAAFDAVKGEGVELKDLLVVCDDVNLKLGALRLRRKGSSGGHNGIESIIECLGTSEFPRLRVGIAGSRMPGDLVRFVLRPFDSAERSRLKSIIKEACECAVTWLKEGADKAMAGYNRRQ